MRTFLLVIATVAASGCALFEPGSAVPPQIADTWRACRGDVMALGLEPGTRITIEPELFGRDQFDLKLRPARPCTGGSTVKTFHGEPLQAATLEKPTLLLRTPTDEQRKSAVPFGGCPVTENVLTADQANALLAYGGMSFLKQFDHLVRERRIHTFASGLGHLREQGSSIDEPHLIISFGYVPQEACNSGAARRYVLAVTSFGGTVQLGMHNGVVHGDP